MPLPLGLELCGWGEQFALAPLVSNFTARFLVVLPPLTGQGFVKVEEGEECWLA